METINFVQEELIQQSKKQAELSPELLLICGSLDFKVMSNLIQLITSKLEILNTGNTFITKTKLLSTEIIQNVFKHGYGKTIRNSFFAMYYDSFNNEVILKSGNLIEKGKLEPLKAKLDTLKNLTKEEIKQKFASSLKSNEIAEGDNAGLGLISIFHRSNGIIDYGFKEVDENLSFYIIEVKYKIN